MNGKVKIPFWLCCRWPLELACSKRIPIWFKNIGKGIGGGGDDAWEQITPEIKDVSLESFKLTEWYNEGMDLEEEKKAYEGFKETYGWLKYMCKIAR